MRPDNAKELSKILFLDIETVPQHFKWSDLDERTAELFSTKTRFEQERSEKTAEELWSEKGGILAEFGKIICIGVGSIHKSGETEALRVTSFQGDDEAELLRRFVELLNTHFNTDDHWLCGHNGKEFDFPYIARRCVVNRIKLPRLLDIAGLKPWEVGHLDTMNLWSFGDRKAYTSLALLTHILEIPTPKDDITGADVARVYHVEKDLERIAAYCRKDVVATAQVFMRLTGRRAIKDTDVVMV
ncbi:MAG: 3'-5' exonuclease [Flavobacteriales bacterium]|nr:3'-5' exonuclease [Flavobacteriales bacterium]MBP6642354.1 3'-5' exonuclease [Flavobacteriales bacterium]MBP7154431.1 3'-5' exonuclease [Flavobacteriales bacterium]HQV74113.1 3'-5' exonuclease [Flavobacteriales bacterium]HQW41026.1 3'-5' exonuclease [Flavobacteriales bacterium]